MEKNKKNEELQSRREFFKKAAKGALPILGAIVLANMPKIAEAETAGSCTCGAGCRGGCSTSCMHECKTTCKAGCYHGCYGTCQNKCYRTSSR